MVHITNIYWPKIRTQKRNNGSLLTEIWMTYNGILDVIEMESISLLHWWMIHSYGYDGLYTVSINSIPLRISILILVAISNHCNYNSFDHFDICTKQPNLPSQILMQNTICNIGDKIKLISKYKFRSLCKYYDVHSSPWNQCNCASSLHSRLPSLPMCHSLRKSIPKHSMHWIQFKNSQTIHTNSALEIISQGNLQQHLRVHTALLIQGPSLFSDFTMSIWGLNLLNDGFDAYY